jgi:steroid delta-isomerase-like uncharacterized protein
VGAIDSVQLNPIVIEEDEMTTDPKIVNDAWRDALNRSDPDGVAACFAEHAVHADHGTGQTAEGRSAIGEVAASFFKAFTNLHIEQTSHLQSGASLAAEWTMKGDHTGDLPGLPATGRSFSVMGAKFAEVHDGKIVSAALYWNMADLLTQVGAFPPPQV